MFLFYDDSLVRSFLSHSIRLILFSLMDLSQAHRLPYHHISGAHVKSLIHPHWVILESSGWTRCTSCYIGAYFPQLPTWQEKSIAILGHIPLLCCGDDRLLMELLSFSLFDRGIFICITGYNIDDLCRDEPLKEPNLWVLTVSLPMTLQ